MAAIQQTNELTHFLTLAGLSSLLAEKSFSLHRSQLTSRIETGLALGGPRILLRLLLLPASIGLWHVKSPSAMSTKGQCIGSSLDRRWLPFKTSSLTRCRYVLSFRFRGGIKQAHTCRFSGEQSLGTVGTFEVPVSSHVHLLLQNVGSYYDMTRNK